jgi:replication initiator protein RepSA
MALRTAPPRRRRALSPEELCDAIGEAAGRARLDGGAGDGQTTDMRFGEQLHTRVLAGAEDGRELFPGRVAAYVAKYSCKASHEQITTRDSDPDRWRDRGVPEQLVQMAAAALRLAQRPGLRDLGRRVHMLGFRGHFVTKSRGYSTTLGELRAARAAYRGRQDEPLDDAEVTDDDPMVVLSVWQYLGSGYLNPGDGSWQPASKHPYGPPVKPCSTCVASHRKRAPSTDGPTSGLLRSSQLQLCLKRGARAPCHKGFRGRLLTASTEL